MIIKLTECNMRLAVEGKAIFDQNEGSRSIIWIVITFDQVYW